MERVVRNFPTLRCTIRHILIYRPAGLRYWNWILDCQRDAVSLLKDHVIGTLQHHHTVKHTTKRLQKWWRIRDLKTDQTPVHTISFPMNVYNTHPNVSTLIDDAVALHIEEFRGSVGNGASLCCPILYCHGFFTSFNLKRSQSKIIRENESLFRYIWNTEFDQKPYCL